MTPSQNSDKVFSIHQPNYIPWLGYFYKIIKSDIFVFLDSVQYPRGQSFSARNKIKTPNGSTWLTIPVSIPSGSKGKASFNEVTFANEKWKDKHLKTIKMSYSKAPYFDEIFELLEPIIRNENSFVELNIHLITAICNYLGIDTTTVRLSELLSEYGEKTQLIIDIAEELSASVYLSGTGGGKNYNDEKLLNEQRIELEYSNFKHPVYDQLWGEFESNLSIIDLLMNHGKRSYDFLTNE